MSEGAGKAPEKRKIQAIKGVRDILPPETSLWNRVEQTAREVFATYGFAEIRLPILEQTELFARAVGEDTEIVNKEMFSLLRKLDILRRATVEQIQDLGNEAQILKFAQSLAVFVANLGQGIALGELEADPKDLAIVNKLRDISEQTVSLWNSGNREPSVKWDRLFDEAKELVSSLDIERVEEAPSLRPEATASVCRAYIEHGMHTLPGNVKLYYMGPMFRRERPQKGRYRQFYQIGAEVLSHSGDLKDDACVDAEVIEMLLSFFAKAGLSGTTLYLNSIGCKDCRPQYVALLRAELTKVKDKLGPDSQRRIETNPLRVLDSKLETEQPIIERLPHIADHLCGPCREQYAEVKKQLSLRNIAFQENWRLVRGLDYYVRTTFEIAAPGLGSQNAVCGGGRYDGLVELLGGPPTKGIGFSIGTDRMILSLLDASKPAVAESSLDVFVAWMGEKTYPAAVKIARGLRDAGVSVELPPGEMKFARALGLADKLGAHHALIIGEDEVASGQFTVKRLADGQQKKLPESALLQYLRPVRRGGGSA